MKAVAMSVALFIGLIGFGRITLARGDGVDHLSLGADTNLMVGVGMVIFALFLLFGMPKSEPRSKAKK